MVARGALIKPWIFEEIEKQQYLDKTATERLAYIERFARYGLEVWGADEVGLGTTRRFLLEWLSFAHRYVPLGILEHLPPKIQGPAAGVARAQRARDAAGQRELQGLDQDQVSHRPRERAAAPADGGTARCSSARRTTTSGSSPSTRATATRSRPRGDSEWPWRQRRAPLTSTRPWSACFPSPCRCTRSPCLPAPARRERTAISVNACETLIPACTACAACSPGAVDSNARERAA